MKIRKLKLKNFKYFDNLSVTITEGADAVVLLGPNGTGKSCIFDAFNHAMEQCNADRGVVNPFFLSAQKDYCRKNTREECEVIITDEKDTNISYRINSPTSKIYGRSAYRFTAEINRNTIGGESASAIRRDADRAIKSIHLDRRLENDVEFALSEMLRLVQNKTITISNIDIQAQIITPTDESVKRILGNDFEFCRIVDPHSSSGTKIDLEFNKCDKAFFYEVLSAGEKEIFDIIFNFHCRKRNCIDGGVYFLDEPELHLNTTIQKKLFNELFRLCKEANAQLWIATHSIGFMRAAQDAISRNENIAILEFNEKLGSGEQILEAKLPSRQDWQRIFSVALDDLASLITPRKLVYCEGKINPDENGNEQGFDAVVYNTIFAQVLPDYHFVSSGGTDVKNNSEMALMVLNKAFVGTEILVLKDRDDKDRKLFLMEAKNNRMLKRRMLENYLFDIKVLGRYCAARKIKLKIENVGDIIKDNIENAMLKSHHQKIKIACGYKGNINNFKKELANILPSIPKIFCELKDCIENNEFGK